MSLEETKQLLRTYRIIPNKLLGQNFMVESALYPKLCTYAALSDSDVVLDVGAGFGFLTRYLAYKCKGVIAVEKDLQVAVALREQVKDLGNVVVIEGDVLKARLPDFNKVIAIPPYYMSSNLVTWLLDQRVECAVLIMQKEFAGRLVASVGSEAFGWLTVVVNHIMEVDLFDAVPKALFYPLPEVDSLIIRLKPWYIKPFEVKNDLFFMQVVKWLFAERNRKLGKAIVPFLKSQLKLSEQDIEKLAHNLPFHDRRVRELLPKDFGVIADALST